MNVLIVEDEKHIADGLAFNLEAEGYDVTVVDTGEAAVEVTTTSNFDAIVLDVMLPGIDGFEVAKTLRAKENYTPILMLTARGRPEDVLNGFEAGTDDYLAKPFDLNIFFARLKGLLRRSVWAAKRTENPTGEIITVNGRTLDFDNLELTDATGVHRLTLMEVKLLRFLVEKEGTAVSRKTILEDVWGLQEDTDTRAIDNFIVRLRKYLEDTPNDPQILKTVRGVGYKFTRR